MGLLAPSEGESVGSLPPDGDEAGLRYRVWAPSDAEPRATLAVLSGVMSNAAWFRPLASRWRAMGYRVLGVDRRGSGLNYAPGSEDTSSARMLLDDARDVIEHGRAPGRPLCVVGWCWGAILGVHLALELDAEVRGLALLTPGLFPSAVIAQRMEALVLKARGRRLGEPSLDSPITDEMFTSGPALEGFVRCDPNRWKCFSSRFLEVSSRLSMVARMRLRKLAPPMLVVLAQDDATVDNEKTLAELARLPAHKVCTASLPGAHGLQFDAPQALAERLDAWARDTLGL